MNFGWSYLELWLMRNSISNPLKRSRNVITNALWEEDPQLVNFNRSRLIPISVCTSMGILRLEPSLEPSLWNSQIETFKLKVLLGVFIGLFACPSRCGSIGKPHWTSTKSFNLKHVHHRTDASVMTSCFLSIYMSNRIWNWCATWSANLIVTMYQLISKMRFTSQVPAAASVGKWCLTLFAGIVGFAVESDIFRSFSTLKFSVFANAPIG